PRQVRGVTAEAVEYPRAHRRPTRDLRAGVHEHVRRVVVDRLRRHRADDADVVRDRADLREEFADLDAGLAELLELRLRAEADKFLPLKLGDLLALGQALGHRRA